MTFILRYCLTWLTKSRHNLRVGDSKKKEKRKNTQILPYLLVWNVFVKAGLWIERWLCLPRSILALGSLPEGPTWPQLPLQVLWPGPGISFPEPPRARSLGASMLDSFLGSPGASQAVSILSFCRTLTKPSAHKCFLCEALGDYFSSSSHRREHNACSWFLNGIQLPKLQLFQLYFRTRYVSADA